VPSASLDATVERTVALTGATGFIGARLAARLRADGWRVRSLVRPTADRRRLAGLEREEVPGTLTDAASLQRLVQGVTAVVHCAGAVRGATPAAFEQSNVIGLTRLVETVAAQVPPPRLLALSSLAARHPELSPYAASKQQGEQALIAAAGKTPWLILRPPAVYGPGDRELLPLFRGMGWGLAPRPGPPAARFSLLYVDDLAAAVAQWLARSEPVQGIFELHDGRVGGYGWNDVVTVVAQLRKRRVWELPVPATVLGWLAQGSVLAARIGGYAPMLTPGKVRELRHPDWVCDNAALSGALGWTPRVTLAEGLRRTLGWGEQ
jgi:nucleoside-diphosphate-sugar epimerase